MSNIINKEIILLSHQIDFFNSNKNHCVIVGGYGSGKSYVSAFKIITKTLKSNTAYYLPTYSLLKEIAIPNIEAILNFLQLGYTINKQEMKIQIQNSNCIFLRSMDNPSRIVGYEVGYSLIDESDNIPELKMQEAFTRITARNRILGACNSTDIVGTPEGFKWLYKFCKENRNNDIVHIIYAKTKDNPYLPKEYLPSLRAMYSQKEFDAYTNGVFINTKSEGQVYYTFDRYKNNSNHVYNQYDILHIGIDFNIGNMSAIIHIMQDDKIIAVDEIIGIYDTRQMINHINKIPNTKKILYPDCAGNQRQSNAIYTNIELLKGAGHEVRYPRKNPYVEDRVTILNGMLENQTYLVNIKKCVKFVESLEGLSRDNNGRIIKTHGFDHSTDAAGYFISFTKKLSRQQYNVTLA